MRIIKIFCLMLLSSIFLTGCFDKIELEERSIVLAIGVDKYTGYDNENIEKTGSKKRFVVSLSTPDISQEEKSNQKDEKSKDENSKSIKKSTSSTIASSMELINSYMSKNLYYGHTKVIVIGKDILEDEILLKETLDALERNNQISRKIIILGTTGKAEDILASSPKDDKVLGIFINDFFKNNKKNSSFTYNVDLEDVISSLLSTKDVAIPNIEIINNDVSLKGMLAIKNNKYIAYLDDNIAKGILWILDKKSLGEISVPFENGYVSTTIFKKKVRKNFYEKNNKIICHIKVNLEGNISEYSLGKNIVLNTNKYKMVENEINNYVKNEINTSLNTIKSLNVDIIKLKELIRKNNYDLYKKYNLENANIYDYIDFNITLNTKIKGSGSVK